MRSKPACPNLASRNGFVSAAAEKALTGEIRAEKNLFWGAQCLRVRCSGRSLV
jgi:hypothetical protein